MSANESPAGSPSFPGAPPQLSTLVGADGASWREFRASLKPRYGRAWLGIAGWYATLLTGYGAALWLARGGSLGVQMAAAPVLAFLFGAAFHAFALFGHEAAHYQLAARRQTNDRLSDWLLWSWTGQSTKGYRRFHWKHHLHLGGHGDTEISYHHCASLLFLLQLATGWYLFQALRRYATGGSSRQVGESTMTGASVARFVGLNGAAAGLPLLAGWWLPGVAWGLGLFVVFPALNTVRQLLEHRHEDAGCEIDFEATPQGPNTYDFGSGLLARLIGPAGFNRHLLHHWDPTISYTNFAEVEGFLRQAGMAPDLDDQRRSYGGALLRALRVARGRR